MERPQQEQPTQEQLDELANEFLTEYARKRGGYRFVCQGSHAIYGSSKQELIDQERTAVGLLPQATRA